MNKTILNETINHDSKIIKPELISTIDPNWFYSAIAQSSAAIVGILGAFLTAKIITQRQEINSIQSEINDNKKKIEFLQDRIKEKKEWVKKIDEEEDLKAVKNFLNEIKDKIDPENPPTIDKLINIGNEHENKEFHNLNRDILKASFNEEYLDEIRANIVRSKNPFANLSPNINLTQFDNLLISPEIVGKKWDRYRRYSDEIYVTDTEMNYLKNLNKVKLSKLEQLKKANHVKKTLMYLGAYSIIGVFSPLFMMTLKISIMKQFMPFFFWFVFLSWLFLLGYFGKEIFQLNHE